MSIENCLGRPDQSLSLISIVKFQNGRLNAPDHDILLSFEFFIKLEYVPFRIAEKHRAMAPELIGGGIENRHPFALQLGITEIDFTRGYTESDLHAGVLHAGRCAVVMPGSFPQAEHHGTDAHREHVFALGRNGKAEQILIKRLHPGEVVAEQDDVIDVLDVFDHSELRWKVVKKRRSADFLQMNADKKANQE